MATQNSAYKRKIEKVGKRIYDLFTQDDIYSSASARVAIQKILKGLRRELREKFSWLEKELSVN